MSDERDLMGFTAEQRRIIDEAVEKVLDLAGLPESERPLARRLWRKSYRDVAALTPPLDPENN